MCMTLMAVSLVLHMFQRPDVVVVAHPQARVTMSDVRETYVGEKEFNGQTRLIPVDNTALQPTFIERVLTMNARRYETLWIKKAFRDARVPPTRLRTDADVLAFIARTPGAVGYVSAVPTDAAVTTVGRH